MIWLISPSSYLAQPEGEVCLRRHNSLATSESLIITTRGDAGC